MSIIAARAGSRPRPVAFLTRRCKIRAVMMKMVRLFPILLLCWFTVPSSAHGEEVAAPEAGAGEEVPLAMVVASHITDTTMTAMSPLLVVSAQGAWEYYGADPSARAALPWYTSPWLWGTLLGLGVLFTLNTAIGNAVPLLKTPMNVVEEHENKVTGFLIGLPMVLTRLIPDLKVPSSVEAVAPVASEPSQTTVTVMEGSVLPVAVSGPVAAAVIAVPIVIACYFFVWLTFHTAHVISLVSPFAAVDTGLKFTRLGLLGTIALLSVVSPWLAVGLCAIIIAISYLIAGWSFRLLVFGTVLSWDLILFRHRRFDPTGAPARGFLCRAVDGTPVRSYGTFERGPDAQCRFHYRPWLLMPRRSVNLDADRVCVQRGILSPVILETEAATSRRRNLVRLRPKFRGHEEAVALQLKAGEVEDHAIKRGLRQAIAWLKDPAQALLPAR